MSNTELGRHKSFQSQRVEQDQAFLAAKRTAAAELVMSLELPAYLEAAYMQHIYGKQVTRLAQQGQA